jgi:hypothetical protein
LEKKACFPLTDERQQRLQFKYRFWRYKSSHSPPNSQLRLFLDFAKWSYGRGIDRTSIHAEHRTVTGAIPARLETVEVQVAADMAAGRGVEMQAAIRVAVRGNLFEAVPDDRAMPGFKLVE